MTEAGRHAIVADQLLVARQAGRLIDSLNAQLADTADGYAAQDALIDSAPWSVVGWKVGATTPAAMKMFGTDEPFCGPIFEGNLFDSTNTENPINLDGFIRPMVEGEFALVLGADLPVRLEEYSSEEIRAAVSAVRPAIEIVDFRLETFATAGLPAIVADCSGNGGLVVGRSTNDWVRADLESAPVAMTVAGTLTGSGVGSDAFGHPVESLRWLANHLSKRGRGLLAGDTVTTGSCTGIAPVAPGQTATADFGDLGQVIVDRT
jgi:2-keto-4-pentenoate hydratase